MGKNVTLQNISEDTQIKIRRNNRYTSLSVHADALFSFGDKLDYICSYVEKGFIPARYCVEDLKYLNIRGLKKVAIPMKCFCDIKLHDINEHLSWYGYYGIAFSKEWGIRNKLQPIQYINPDSFLRVDFSEAFSDAIKNINKRNNTLANDYMLEQLLFLKQYSGKFRNRNTNKNNLKCFAEECEWRFIPPVTKRGYSLIYNMKDHKQSYINMINECMANDAECGLKFEYSDIKYLIVSSKEDLNRLTDCICTVIEDKNLRYHVISKIIVWNECGRDF